MRIIDCSSDVCSSDLRQQQGTAFAMEERREELQRFGAWSGLALIHPQQRRIIAPESRPKPPARRIELAQIVRAGLNRRTHAPDLVSKAIEQAHAHLRCPQDPSQNAM